MKNKLNLFGFIALVAIIVFSMAACGGGDDDGDVKEYSTVKNLSDTRFNGEWTGTRSVSDLANRFSKNKKV